MVRFCASDSCSYSRLIASASDRFNFSSIILNIFSMRFSAGFYFYQIIQNFYQIIYFQLIFPYIYNRLKVIFKTHCLIFLLLLYYLLLFILYLSFDIIYLYTFTDILIDQHMIYEMKWDYQNFISLSGHLIYSHYQDIFCFSVEK